jgi:hypothetical protein
MICLSITAVLSPRRHGAAKEAEKRLNGVLESCQSIGEIAIFASEAFGGRCEKSILMSRTIRDNV